MTKPCGEGCECRDCLDVVGMGLLNAQQPCECGDCNCGDPIPRPGLRGA